ncbi:unnamed protein product, partial [Anisakis simplex]|uniref:EB domain-containing protein n=1 Tax=Anisakis simplex TaxID=6269 RepID=A0A0M3JVQ5_ANISI
KLIGSKCLFDEECYGINTVCRDQRCTCPTNFEEYDIDSQTTHQIAFVACPSGQQLYGVECQRVAHWGQACDKDSQCIDVFNACIAGICQCSPGTSRDIMKQMCFAGIFFHFTSALFTSIIYRKITFQYLISVCPDGTKARQSCRRLFINDIDMLENAASTDSCPLGYRCVTYGSPYVGHCCRLRCPYGEPDLTQSCDRGAPEDERCRPLTHHCYTVTEPGWKSSLCCPKPCREPTPLFINNQCLSIAHRDDPCQIDQQCEGGVKMSCVLGTCQCKLGFHASNDDRFATCQKTCPIDEVAVTDKCLRHVQLGQQCVTNRQCPNFSECRFGSCRCLCGYKQDSLIGTRCTNPDDPFSLNAILTGVEQVFGGKSRPS